MNITDTFVNNILCFSSRPTETEVLHHAHKCYLDYLGCAILGSKQNEDKVNALIEGGLFSRGNCSVLGLPINLSFRDAGFVNGFNAHCMELDDGHRYAMLHIEAPIFSAMLALWEKEKISVEDFYRGIIVGYEATVRVSRALQPWHKVRGFHSTGTCATIGVAMAVSAALRFDFNQTKSALTAAASSAAGLLEILSDDSELKPYNVGRAVMDGLTAAYIGRANYKGPADILGGKRGFLNVMTDTPTISFLDSFKSDEKHSILGNFFKPYPACRHCHSTIDAALNISKTNDIDLSKIRRIRIEVYKLALVGHDHKDVQSPKAAMMSIPYGAVVALVYKAAGFAQYSEDVVKSEEIQSLLSKVEITENIELTKLLPDIRGSIVKVETDDKQYNCRIDYSLGEPENPMDDNAIIAKFLDLTNHARLSQNTAKDLVKRVFNNEVITRF